ncbi:hypothetical protein JAAARDRAFT_124085 [Jaapia argillacea MUCL 33604]|uniref:DUF3074 domain-containing protein n=1 Tax=Jaapia argillacea MUCL 33604 TaxID=933084 RepID=A0A067Q3P2_9AGAM|nr:hypothetical protein JAAARDRAFT_124085 [Jaapia argillacea MUCL 33604]
MSDYKLTITPIKPDEIPPEETILALGQEVLESTSTWKQGKSYHNHTVKTLSRPKGPGDGASWHCRLSEHKPEDATFDEFWSKVGVNKAENEMKFIGDIKKVTLIKQISPTMSIWSMYYHLPPPISARTFTVLQVTHLYEASPRSGIIVSIPVDVTHDPELAKLEEKAVKGRYVAAERFRELENGNVEWIVATSSTPGGMIPQFITDKSMPSKISDDVPHFLHWFHTVRDSPTNTN